MAMSCPITFWHMYMSFYSTNYFHRVIFKMPHQKTNKKWKGKGKKERCLGWPNHQHYQRGWSSQPQRSLGVLWPPATTPLFFFHFFFPDVFSNLCGKLIWCWLKDMYKCENVIEYDVIISLYVIVHRLNPIEWFDMDLYSFFFFQNLKSCCAHKFWALMPTILCSLNWYKAPCYKLP